MTQPITAPHDLTIWRNDDYYEYPIRVVGRDLTNIALAMEVRLGGDVPGPAIIALDKVVPNVGGAGYETEGVQFRGVSVVDGVEVSDVRIRMHRGTLQALPYFGEVGDPAEFEYALVIGGRTRLSGRVILPAHPYRSDSAPASRASGYGSRSAARAASPDAGATLTISQDGGATVVIDGADLIGGLREGAELARDEAVAAAAEAVIALDNLSEDAIEFIGRPGGVALVDGTPKGTGAVYWHDAVDHPGTLEALDVFNKGAGTVRVAAYRGTPSGLTRIALATVTAPGGNVMRTLTLSSPIAVLPGDILALQPTDGTLTVNEVQSGDAGYTYSFPDLPETISLDAPTTNGQMQVRWRVRYREQVVTAEKFAELSAVKILSARAVALSSAANPRGYVEWTTSGQPTAHTVKWGSRTVTLGGDARRMEFPSNSLAQPFAFVGNSLTDSTDVTDRWSQVLAARYGQPFVSVARYSSDGRMVYRTGAKPIVLTLAGTLPATGTVAVTQINGAPIDGNNPAAFLTTGDAGLTTGMSMGGYVERNGVTRRVTVSAPNAASFAYRVALAPGETAITFDGPVTFTPDFALAAPGRTAVVWMGNNFFFSGVANEYGDHTNPGMWVDLKLIVSFLQARGCRVLLLPVIPAANWTERGPGTSYDAHLAANARTEALFPGLMARHADGRTLLQFLQSRNDGSANDLADVAAGFTPRSLRRNGDLLHLNTAGDLAVADFVDSALQAQALPDLVTQTTDFTITAIGAGDKPASTAVVRVARDAVVAELTDAIGTIAKEAVYRPTIAAAIADFEVGTFFTSRDLDGVTAHAGIKWQYKVTDTPPYWSDEGAWTDTDAAELGLGAYVGTTPEGLPVSIEQAAAIADAVSEVREAPTVPTFASNINAAGRTF
jgi:hypothetical protein